MAKRIIIISDDGVTLLTLEKLPDEQETVWVYALTRVQDIEGELPDGAYIIESQRDHLNTEWEEEFAHEAEYEVTMKPDEDQEDEEPY